MYLNWTGDGRGIDYIQPGNRFQDGYKLPLPIFAIAAVVRAGVTLLNGTAFLVSKRRVRSLVLWLAGIGGLAIAVFPLLDHGGYRFWQYWNEGGESVFRSGDWSIGLSLALTEGILAIAGVLMYTKWSMGRS